MKKTVKKNYYLTPAVKVVAFQVEQGFAGSGETTPPTANGAFIPVSRNRVAPADGDPYHWNTAPTEGNDAWF